RVWIASFRAGGDRAGRKAPIARASRATRCRSLDPQRSGRIPVHAATPLARLQSQAPWDQLGFRAGGSAAVVDLETGKGNSKIFPAKTAGKISSVSGCRI